ncbi:MAG: NGG1p interacting factor NIF3 [Candidatus Omnitrophica bacterium]|nr:NGG1p interacting factor NIF3 [Candidatus Omnitrophota bacterium]
MKLRKIYDEAVKKGKENDPRSLKEIDYILKERKAAFNKLDPKEKRFFDVESLTNPYSDTRILWGDQNAEIKSAIVGIDIEGPELLLIDSLRKSGTKIDLALAHHPEGHAFANFYETMDVQIDVFAQTGMNLAAAQNLLAERRSQVERRVSAANHQRTIDIARLLDINFLCMHTVCDNLAYQYMNTTMKQKKPKTIADVLAILFDIPEYQYAAKINNPPKIFIGSRNSRVAKIHFEFTGGTEGPQDIYDKLSAQGVDTIVAMHQSEDHYQRCKKANINVVVASHIASDNVGVNLMLDHLLRKDKVTIHEFSGFTRVARKR